MTAHPSLAPVSPPAAAPQPTIRRVADADVPALAAAMARAFYDDPVVAWCMPGDATRTDRMRRCFELFMRRIHLRHDHSHATAELSGGALWLPPGEAKLGAGQQLGILPRLARITRGEFPRTLRALNYMEERHPEEPHHYLQFLGVEPEWQGRGLGSALMEPTLERADREGEAAYLEASSPRSRDLYLRHGFEVVEEIHLPGGGPPMWRMWRDPVAV